jgi:hypothetical protein
MGFGVQVHGVERSSSEDEISSSEDEITLDEKYRFAGSLATA